MTLGVECRICRKTVDVVLTPDHYVRYEMWKSGKITHIQDALPDIPADQRELFISGTCAVCWNEMFGDEDEEEDIEE